MFFGSLLREPFRDTRDDEVDADRGHAIGHVRRQALGHVNQFPEEVRGHRRAGLIRADRQGCVAPRRPEGAFQAFARQLDEQRLRVAFGRHRARPPIQNDDVAGMLDRGAIILGAVHAAFQRDRHIQRLVFTVPTDRIWGCNGLHRTLRHPGHQQRADLGGLHDAGERVRGVCRQFHRHDPLEDRFAPEPETVFWLVIRRREQSPHRNFLY